MITKNLVMRIQNLVNHESQPIKLYHAITWKKDVLFFLFFTNVSKKYPLKMAMRQENVILFDNAYISDFSELIC